MAAADGSFLLLVPVIITRPPPVSQSIYIDRVDIAYQMSSKRIVRVWDWVIAVRPISR